MTFERADEADLAAWRELAAAVAVTLRRAGLPVDEQQGARSAVNVSVDPSPGDANGGVWVGWSTSREHSDAMFATFERTGTISSDDPDVRFNYAVGVAMTKALLSILRASGFTARQGDNDLAELHIHVLDGPQLSG